MSHTFDELLGDDQETWTSPSPRRRAIWTALRDAGGAPESWWAVVHRDLISHVDYVEATPPVVGRERREMSLERTSYEVKEAFERLAEEWQQSTLFTASVLDVVLDDRYQQIIGLGPQAVPLIMGRLRHEVGHWFWALKSIVGVDVAEGAETLEEARRLWLRWFDEEVVGG